MGGPKLTAKLMPLLLCDGALGNIDPPGIDSFEEAKEQLLPFWMNRGNLHSVFVFSRSEANFEVEKDGGQLKYIAKLFEEGKLKSTMKKTFKLDELQEAHKLQESGKAIGKIGLSIVHEQAHIKTFKPQTQPSWPNPWPDRATFCRKFLKSQTR